jgi:hypothetical protein
LIWEQSIPQTTLKSLRYKLWLKSGTDFDSTTHDVSGVLMVLVQPRSNRLQLALNEVPASLLQHAVLFGQLSQIRHPPCCNDTFSMNKNNQSMNQRIPCEPNHKLQIWMEQKQANCLASRVQTLDL